MQKIIYLICCCCLGVSSVFCQQPCCPPAEVLLAFNSEHLLVKTSSWSLNDASFYRAQYTLFGDKRIHVEKFDRLGHPVEKQTQIDYAQLPLKAQTELTEHFKNYSPSKCIQLMRTGKEPGYTVTVERWSMGHVFKERYKVILSAKGDLLEKSDIELDLPELPSPPENFGTSL